jgi:hypothetical protein
MYQVRRQNKYNNTKCEYNGIIYHSRKEAGYAEELDLRLKAGDIAGWDRQVKVELKAYGRKICNYYMDFVVEHNDGTREWVEVKGFETAIWRLKWKLFEAQMDAESPEDRLTIVK